MKKNEKPKFVLASGQIDFTHIKRAPVLNCVVQYKDKVLIVKRSEELNFYPGFWNGIGGFLDFPDKSLEEMVYNELKEELGIKKGNIVKIRMGKVFEIEEPEYNKTWIMHPILAHVNTDKIILDWEAQDYKWVNPEEVRSYDVVPSFLDVLEAALRKD